MAAVSGALATAAVPVPAALAVAEERVGDDVQDVLLSALEDDLWDDGHFADGLDGLGVADGVVVDDEVLLALESSLLQEGGRDDEEACSNKKRPSKEEGSCPPQRRRCCCAASSTPEPLHEPAPPKSCGLDGEVPTAAIRAADETVKPTFEAIGMGLVHWPIEVRLCIASCLVWQEFVVFSRLCWAWRRLDRHDALWQVYFHHVWPRLARRRDAHSQRGLPWRTYFRTRWAEANRSEDALEEDWLDFSAAQDLTHRLEDVSGAVGCADLSQDEHHRLQLNLALRRCVEDLQVHGIRVPVEPDHAHLCSAQCRFHRLLEGQDAFVCETSGLTHSCRFGVPCDLCVLSNDDHFLVCPVSGRCFVRTNDATGEAAQAATAEAANDWDPGLSMTQQFGRWFEQGYSMTEEQARDFFDGEGEAYECRAPQRC